MITGLDIGSSRISAVAAEIGGDNICNVLAHASHASRGVMRGAVVDMGDAVSSVSRTLAKLKDKMGRRPENIFVTVSGHNVKGERSRGMIPLSMRGREVTKADIERCVNVASTIKLPFDREVLHRITHNFSVDDQPPVKNPAGLYASRLSCEMYIITADVNHIQNLHKCVNDAGYDVSDLVFTGIADGAALLDDSEKEAGAALLHMGKLLTDVSIFTGGVLDDMAVIPVGADDIDGAFGESITFDGLTKRIQAIMEAFSKRGGNIGSVTLTGGLAFADGIIETLEERFPYPIKMGIVKDVRGEISGIDSIRLAAAIGSVRYANGLRAKKAVEKKSLIQRVSSAVVELFNNYF